MKRRSITGCAVFGFCLLILACTDEKDAAQQRGSAILQPLTATKAVEAKVTVLEVQKSIQEYYAANGRYPVDLNEAAAFTGTTFEIDKYVYDPAAGTVALKP